jgi:nitrate/TMAO reductase-like tetraheme cytochrome c subunit
MGPARRTFGQRLRWLLLCAAAGLGAFLVLLLVMVGSAAWYTSRSEFCKSCHIMEPYYKSWAESSHKDVPCIECHFAPGFGGKIRGKLLGLVQLAKYVTSSAGPRPAAEVPDASCLRSGCHETRLLSGKVQFHGVAFDHTPHLGPARRGKQLRCTSCHSQIVQGTHMTVTPSTCFLCHFKEQRFDEGLAACTRCHQIPDKAFDLGGGVKFTHELAFKKGVECINCHGDVVRGNGDVPRERCQVCHNREGDIERSKDHVFIHHKHVTEHAINCLNCHLTIEHSLDKQKMVHGASDCDSCHPDHHREQIAMFEGVGGAITSGPVGGMMTARVGCRTCHRLKELSVTGATLWKSSAGVCSMCHEASQAEQLKNYHVQLRAALPELEAAVQRARKALPAAKLASDRLAADQAGLDSIQHDLDFLQTGNDIHNIHYASKLTQVLRDRTAAICRELKVAEPKVTLPPALKQWK